jgi:hypothetical protein
MTSSSLRRVLVLALGAALATPLAWAGLGESEGSIDTARVRMHARHAIEHKAQYTVHELKTADGSRVQQYVANNGLVFAVRWNTQYKPDLSALMGASFPAYAGAAQEAAQRGGIQRHFRHDGSDLVVQSAGHLHVFSGYAYRRSLMPRGLDLRSLGLG